MTEQLSSGARARHSAAYRNRRALNSAMCMGRYNLSFANRALSDTYGGSKTQIGAILMLRLWNAAPK